MTALPQLALFGGSFDPVHNAHKAIVASVIAQLKPQCLRVIPCHQPPHKAALVASNEDRLAMLNLAFGNVPKVEIDGRELSRDGLSYTFDTVSEYRQEQGPGLSLIFVIGADSWLDFTSWHRWRDILTKVNLLILKRPDIELRDDLASSHLELQGYCARNAVAIDELAFFPFGKIAMIDNPELAIASKVIRQSIAAGKMDADEWLPASVANYIAEHHLYGSESYGR